MSPGQTNSQSVSCPECGTSFVEYLKDAETGDIVRPEDRRLFVCMICRHIFPVFADESPSIMRDAIGTAIEGDRKCPSCGYNLRTLKIGGRCPECAWSIRPEVTWTRPIDEDPWNHWDTAIIFTFVTGALVLWRIGKNNALGVSVCLTMFGVILALKGCGGLATGRISIGKSFLRRTVAGRWAVVYSIVHIVVATAFALLAAAIHFRWF